MNSIRAKLNSLNLRVILLLVLSLLILACSPTASENSNASSTIFATPRQFTVKKGTEVQASDGRSATLPENVEVVTIETHQAEVAAILGR